MAKGSFLLPAPNLQIALSNRLVSARSELLQPALLETVARCDIQDLDEEAHRYVPVDGLHALATRGLRAELIFALPTILRRKPQLLAYYRLVLGFSQKAFFSKQAGLSGFLRAEVGRGFSEDQDATLPDLCTAINQAATLLVTSIEESLSTTHIHDLALLTLGTQLRGGWNVGVGAAATQQVIEAIREIVGQHAQRVEAKRIAFEDSTGRAVEVRFGSDPDVEAVSINPTTKQVTPLLAIEVKGGTDYSNVHNRLGEAEKSHLKAKNQHGHTDMWTITNVAGLAENVRKRASPTTTAFFDLADIVARNGKAYEDFRERLLQKLRLPG